MAIYPRLKEKIVKRLVSQFYATLCDPMDCSPQAPLSIGFSRQEYWSGLPCPSPGDLPDPGIAPRCLAFQADSLPFELLGELHFIYTVLCIC